MISNELSAKTLDKMMGELKSVIKDAENLLKNTEKQEGEAFKLARAKFEATVKNAKSELLDLEECVVEKIKDAAHTTDQYVKEHPWNMIGVGACVGLLVGFLIGRKS